MRGRPRQSHPFGLAVGSCLALLLYYHYLLGGMPGVMDSGASPGHQTLAPPGGSTVNLASVGQRSGYVLGTIVVGLVDQSTVDYALNWLCSWRARSAAEGSAVGVAFACADAECERLLEAVPSSDYVVISLGRDGDGIDHLLLGDEEHWSDDRTALLHKLVSMRRDGDDGEPSSAYVLLSRFFRLVGGLAARRFNVVVMNDMRQVWVGNPLDFVHTHPNRGQMDDLQTIGHPTLRAEHRVTFTNIGAMRSAPAVHPCGAFVYVACGDSAVVRFFDGLARQLVEGATERTLASIVSLTDALPDLCALADVGALSSALKMRSLDPDLFHPDSTQVLQRHRQRAYQARPIPLIPPVVAYFPPSANREGMVRHGLWLLGEEGQPQSCRAFDESAWPVPNAPPDGSDVRIVLKVLTYKRPEALQRLLQSLVGAEYDGDEVNLDVFVDYDEQQNAAVLQAAKQLDWPHGRKRIFDQGRNVGLAFQWLGSFVDSAYGPAPATASAEGTLTPDMRAFPLPPLPAKPLPNNEFAYIMEDDLEQSTQFYRWIKRAIQQYHTDKRHYTPRAPGSLQLPVFTNSTPFFYPLIGSWGTLAFPKPWEQFIHWFRQIKTADPSFQPFIDKTLPSKWMIKKPMLWTPWIIRVHEHVGLLRGPGLHVHQSPGGGLNYHKKGKSTHELVTTYEEVFFRMPPPGDLLAVDLCAAPIANLQELDGRYDALFVDH
ncbi:uncharacterized protein ACA1_214990 [Acanthamoeba castellanii str. Neff]|uniref:Uncharacterized protein n=1 Tax=Acanthamoeba castellanii (strain ATCC 30010 / Neff) TaxID=1257118 RepID=L8GQ08_ACACF|nr:uncharacterized protein ACA1_214990 [Acanthamoeba castellanii str. Neff]ELR15070.1 hypothetical protein ACA1_214990 [Acanthamoeba castellanii str. Neff]